MLKTTGDLVAVQAKQVKDGKSTVNRIQLTILVPPEAAAAALALHLGDKFSVRLDFAQDSFTRLEARAIVREVAEALEDEIEINNVPVDRQAVDEALEDEATLDDVEDALTEEDAEIEAAAARAEETLQGIRDQVAAEFDPEEPIDVDAILAGAQTAEEEALAGVA